ncbi:hypothetical protein RB213_011399 [Colletotrichum asianum]
MTSLVVACDTATSTTPVLLLVTVSICCSALIEAIRYFNRYFKHSGPSELDNRDTGPKLK